MRLHITLLSLVASVHAIQRTALTRCDYDGTHGKYTSTYMHDINADICKPGRDTFVRVDIPDMRNGRNFYFKAYGTWCKFFFDRDWEGANIGEPVGHADCPGMKDIKGMKAMGQTSDSKDGLDVRGPKECWPASLERPPPHHTVKCYSLLKFSWEGCLSCGPPM